MEILRRFLPLFVLITCLCFLLYVVGQQNLRLSANDPQIQMAEDLVTGLSTDEDTLQVSPLRRIDMSKSLATFMITYDANGKVISASGDLHGKVPNVPIGVFAYTKEHMEDRFTWQPETGVRIAAVMKHFSGRTTGYVLVGRSLREVEKREELLLKHVLLTYIGTLVLTLITVSSTSFGKKKKK